MKLNKSSIVNVVAAVLALAGVIVAYVSHAYTSANAVSNATMMIIAGVVAVALSVLPAFLKNDIVALVAPMGAIACMMYVFNMIISERILMIAGIFSYDAGNTDGWTVFYITVAAAVCLLVSVVINIVTAFGKNEQ